ncbi:MAG: hypothetical protein ACE5JF_12390 [Anaerolineales bacterium]
MYAENELLFPSNVIPKLRESRGEDWAKLVEQVSRLPEDHPESLAFSLMMIRLDGCMACETDSYRAMKGCMGCALQTLRRHKGPDRELLQHYKEALLEIEEHLESLPAAPLFIPARAA